MRRYEKKMVLVIFSLACAHARDTPRVAIDGDLSDKFWPQLHSEKLLAIEKGAVSEIGGEVRAAISGGFLYLSARLPEAQGRVTARSIGRNPIWEGGGEDREVTQARQYAYGTPEGEDFVRFVIRVYNENDWM